MSSSTRSRTSRGAGQRQLRVGEELRHALAAIFARGELRDPELAGRSLTVTEVRVAPDLRNVTAYVVPLGGVAPKAHSSRVAQARSRRDAPTAEARHSGDGDQQLLSALGRSAPFLRARLAEMVQLRYSPKLFFAIDRSFDAARRIEEVLRDPKVARDLADSRVPGEKDDEPPT